MGLPRQATKKKNKLQYVWIVAIAMVVLPLLYRDYRTHILPNVFIENVSVSGLSFEQTERLIRENLDFAPPTLITLSLEGKQYILPTSDISLHYYPDAAVKSAFTLGKTGSLWEMILTLRKQNSRSVVFRIPMTYDEGRLQTWIQTIADELDRPGKIPTATLRAQGNLQSLVIYPGKLGRVVDKTALKEQIVDALSHPPFTSEISRDIPLIVSVPLTKNEELGVKQRVSSLLGRVVQFSANGKVFTWNDQSLVSFLSLPHGYNQEAVKKEVGRWVESVDQPLQEPEMHVEQGRVTSFVPPQQEIKLQLDQSLLLAKEALHSLEGFGEKKEHTLIQLPFSSVDPKQKLEDINILGIRERVGFAESYFHHSIPQRVDNVKLTAQRMNLTLIPPGGTFSYNAIVGEVSGRTGFKPAYIIKDGRTILGDGGGLCQGSTTMFRAALNAGLPIIERRGHSYRVSYYEENALPGIDATVYAPSVDFKFKNDTPSNLLITVDVDPKNYHMVIQFWGTSDGRKSEILNHVVYDKTPPLPTRYEDDPTLPPGKMKQIDWSAPGAKTSFVYKVTRGNEVLQNREFKTTYQPWAAVYLRGI
ncbi:MAG: VanW family protein [Candidatus Pacebacteria bacterium]|nr:VanW family protein [Candidatus Paceibacterota bacterium]